MEVRCNQCDCRKLALTHSLTAYVAVGEMDHSIVFFKKAEIGFKALSRASEVRHSLLRKSIAMELTRWHRVSNQSTVHLRRRTPRRPRSRSRTNCRRLQSTSAWYGRRRACIVGRMLTAS